MCVFESSGDFLFDVTGWPVIDVCGEGASVNHPTANAGGLAMSKPWIDQAA